MDQNQINQVKAVIETYSSLDIEKLIADAYKDQKDLASVKIGEFSAIELAESLNKVFIQFREELDTTYAKSLPFQYNFHNEFGSGNLHADLNQIVAYIQGNQFANIPPYLNRIIHYQAINGFWEKSKRKYFNPKDRNFAKEAERIDIVSKHLESLLSESNTFFASLTQKEEELDNFIKQKQSQLSEIDSLLTAARQHASEINELNSKSATLTEKISALSETSSEKEESISELLATINKQQSESKKLTAAIKSTLDEYTEMLSTLNEDYETSLATVKSKTEYFEERNNYLNALTGREVGASLFETFKQRKTELAPSVNFWKWTVPVMTVATIAWIFFLFGNGNLSDITLQVFGINTLKTIPAVFLLLFSISQYSKERHFQEEYAFKSAVALTVNAYADQLKDAANKDKLIMDSVGEIYKTPIDAPKHKNKESKAAFETAKGLADVAKGLVNKN
jgi:predicted  nucleic acid-binding Zn-ribbon protein